MSSREAQDAAYDASRAGGVINAPTKAAYELGYDDAAAKVTGIRGFTVVSDEAWIFCDREPCEERCLPQTLGEAIDWAMAHLASHDAEA